MRNARVLLGLLALGVNASAQQPPAAAAAPAQVPVAQAPQPAATTPTLGRLFFTPAERSTLDGMRRGPVAVATVTAEKAPPPPPGPEYVTLNGVVRRSDGATTVWLNNKPVQGNRSVEGLVIAPGARAGAPGNVTVRVPQTGRSVDLKVGQQLEVTSGQVQESYRAPPPATATPGSAAPGDTSTERAAQRRPSRDRELLRELLREIDGPAADRPEPPAAKG